MVQVVESDEVFEEMSNEQLSEVLTRCQRMIFDGSAELEDFEAFVLCQSELARRTWA